MSYWYQVNLGDAMLGHAALADIKINNIPFVDLSYLAGDRKNSPG